jgi:diguanylate cyclase (GGDEF)-like protein
MEHALIGTVRQILDGPVFQGDVDVLDELTGAHSARAGVLRLDQETRRALRFRHSLSCFVLEIDGLTTVIQTHGRRRADHVLQDVGTILRHSVRATDIVCRLDAERFLLVTPRLEAAAAEALAERIRIKVARHRFPVPGGNALALTATIGVACVGDTSGGADALIHRAFNALAAARSAGCDRVALG